jgi:hypothetical protein
MFKGICRSFYACIPHEGDFVEICRKHKKPAQRYRKDFEISPYFALYPIRDVNEPKQKICNNVRLTMIERKIIQL